MRKVLTIARSSSLATLAGAATALGTFRARARPRRRHRAPVGRPRPRAARWTSTCRSSTGACASRSSACRRASTSTCARSTATRSCALADAGDARRRARARAGARRARLLPAPGDPRRRSLGGLALGVLVALAVARRPRAAAAHDARRRARHGARAAAPRSSSGCRRARTSTARSTTPTAPRCRPRCARCESLGDVGADARRRDRRAARRHRAASSTRPPAARRWATTLPRLTVASDLHNNVIALPALERAARGGPLLFAGDLTDRGSPVEQALVLRVARAGTQLVFVSGNHDSDVLERKLARDGRGRADAQRAPARRRHDRRARRHARRRPADRRLRRPAQAPGAPTATRDNGATYTPAEQQRFADWLRAAARQGRHRHGPRAGARAARAARRCATTRRPRRCCSSWGHTHKAGARARSGTRDGAQPRLGRRRRDRQPRRGRRRHRARAADLHARCRRSRRAAADLVADRSRRRRRAGAALPPRPEPATLSDA